MSADVPSGKAFIENIELNIESHTVTRGKQLILLYMLTKRLHPQTIKQQMMNLFKHFQGLILKLQMMISSTG